MVVRTFVPRTSLTTMLSEITYTRGRLKADPEGAPHLATFVALRQQWTPIHYKEVMLREAVADAQALVDHQDGRFKAFTYKLVAVLDDLVGEDRKHELFVRYFGRKTPSAFRGLSLAKKHAAMQEWQKHLDTSPDDALKALAPELVELMADGAAALDARTDAGAAQDRFRYAGERSAFIEAVNAARKELWGALAKRRHENPKLPKNFADGFFRREPHEEEKAPTIESVNKEIEALKKKLDTKLEELGALEAAQAAEQAVVAKQQVLKALAQQKAELDQQEAAIRAEIEAQGTKKAQKSRKSSKTRK